MKSSKTKQTLYRLAVSAMFIAIGIVLPFFTGQIQQIGNMLLPMHLPVFLCGMICGWQYGGAVGFILPLLRSVTFSMPPLFPNAVAMAVELCVYGLAAGIIYNGTKRKNTLSVYISMVPAMLLGRAAWGGAQIVLLGIKNTSFTWKMFIAGAFTNAVPGIILQLLLIPAIMTVLQHTGTARILNKENTEE